MGMGPTLQSRMRVFFFLLALEGCRNLRQIPCWHRNPTSLIGRGRVKNGGTASRGPLLTSLPQLLRRLTLDPSPRYPAWPLAAFSSKTQSSFLSQRLD